MTETPEPLKFETDKGASRSFWIASALLLAVILWMGSGFILPSETEETAPAETTERRASVSVQDSVAEPITLTFQAEGQAQPDRDTQLRAEASGVVSEILIAKGEMVERDAVIARLSTTAREADLTRATEELARAQREFDNSEQLLDRGVSTADRVAEARADLASAEAQVTAAREALKDAEITAPFTGRLETLSLDQGEYVTAGEQVGRIVDNKPLTVEIQVPQQALGQIQAGQEADVTFITGEKRKGRVSFVGSAAVASTRTFLAEIEVANEDGAIPAGISAEILIPTGEAQAHFLHPSTVSLNEAGELGVKTVQDGKVVFQGIEIVKAELSGVWATGLPPEAEIIVIGQGFVRDGEAVDARPAPEGTE